MKKILSGTLIIVGIVIYTMVLFTFLEMTVNYRAALIIGEYLMCAGISISSISEKEK